MKIEVKGPIVSDYEKRIYDWFGLPATSPSVVKNAISRAAKGEELEVIINSGGGSVFDGSDIYATLKDYDGNVIVKITGLAASAASVIAMAGDKVMMSPTAQLMIHNSSIITSGNHSKLNKTVDFLKKVDKTIASAYELKTGMGQEELLALMGQETWMTSKEALDAKFIDEVMFSEGKIVASIDVSYDGTLPQEVISKMINQLAPGTEASGNDTHTHANNGIKPQDDGLNINNKLEEENMTLEELKNKHPELYNQVKDENKETVTDESKVEKAKNEAITAERDRVAALNNLKNIPGASNIVEEAIKNGDSVNDTTIKIANSEEVKNIGKAGVENKDFKEDIKNSGAGQVKSETLKNKEEEEEEATNTLIENIVGIKNSTLGSR